ALTRRIEISLTDASLTVADTFALAHGTAFETALITTATAEPLGDSPAAGFLLTLATRTCRVLPLPGTRADRIETHVYQDGDNRAQPIRRLVFNALTPASAATIGYRLEPVSAPSPHA
ncbi:MAG: hypothetical protein H7067_18955, partial [Burkholderiales bacterium]|nr:hypothetical protein [Opitutaceae bacterium]